MKEEEEEEEDGETRHVLALNHEDTKIEKEEEEGKRVVQ